MAVAPAGPVPGMMGPTTPDAGACGPRSKLVYNANFQGPRWPVRRSAAAQGAARATAGTARWRGVVDSQQIRNV